MEGITGVLFRGRINGSGTVVRARRNNGCRHAVRCNLLNLAVDLAILRRPAIRHGRRRSLPSATPRGARIPPGHLAARPPSGETPRFSPWPSHISGAAPESRAGVSPRPRRALLRYARFAPDCTNPGQPGNLPRPGAAKHFR
jgi:hypothetical protein